MQEPFEGRRSPERLGPRRPTNREKRSTVSLRNLPSPQCDWSGGADTEERKPLPRFVSFERGVLAFLMAALCLITMANVVVRYLTNASFAFTEEISVSLMVVMTLVGAATAFCRDKHIAIVFLVDRFRARTQARFALFALAASAVMFALLAWYGGRMAWDDYRFEVTSPALGVPQWLYTVWLPVISLLIVVRLVHMMMRRLKAG
jgi:TRAP-type C4-dicarboxylate transport system permease small subunit